MTKMLEADWRKCVEIEKQLRKEVDEALVEFADVVEVTYKAYAEIDAMYGRGTVPKIVAMVVAERVNIPIVPKFIIKWAVEKVVARMLEKMDRR